MVGIKQTSNLYPNPSVGLFVYKLKHRVDRWCGHRRWGKRTRSALFYSFEEAVEWVDKQPSTYEEAVSDRPKELLPIIYIEEDGEPSRIV